MNNASQDINNYRPICVISEVLEKVKYNNIFKFVQNVLYSQNTIITFEIKDLHEYLQLNSPLLFIPIRTKRDKVIFMDLLCAFDS